MSWVLYDEPKLSLFKRGTAIKEDSAQLGIHNGVLTYVASSRDIDAYNCGDHNHG